MGTDCPSGSTFLQKIKWIVENLDDLNALVVIMDAISVVAANASDITALVADSDDLPQEMYYEDSGTANSVELNRKEGNALAQSWEGMAFLFSPAFANTGDVTVQIDILSAVPMLSNGAQLSPGLLDPDELYMGFYVSGNVEVRRIVTQADLETKVDKITGKGLSTNDLTDALKAVYDGYASTLGNKVDKVTGKGLSENDLTDTLKATYDAALGDAGNLMANNGYQKLSNGLIIQWGYVVNTAVEIVTVTLPIAFPNNIFIAVGGPESLATGEDGNSSSAGKDGTSLSTILATMDNAVDTSWIAIGN